MSGSQSEGHARQDLPASGAAGLSLARRFASRLEKLDSRIGATRLVFTIVILGVVVALFGQASPTEQVLLVLVAIALFLLSGFIQKKVQREVVRWQAISKSLEGQMVRRSRDFNRLCRGGEDAVLTPWCLARLAQSPAARHPYATDLDVHRLLYPFLDTCLTPEGSERLYSLLMDKGLDVKSEAFARAKRTAAIRKQHRLLRELDASRFLPETRALGLRLVSKPERRDDSPEPGLFSRREAIVLWGFGLLSIGAWAALLIPAHLAFLEGGPAENYLGSLFRYALVPLLGLGLFKGVLTEAHRLRERFFGLSLLMRHLSSLEKTPELAELAGRVRVASRDLKRMEIELGFLHARGNPVFWLLIHALLPYDTLLCLGVWLQLGRLSKALEPLERGLFEFDVDAAFARYASENDDFCTSEWVERGQAFSLVLEADAMGHPLLPRQERVTNSLVWEREQGVILLTGSNMSGKSTFLRTLGINALLHNIGVPICARSFRAGSLELLCAIRVDDALEAGTSYFYAEVKRLAQVLSRLGERAKELSKDEGVALFLVDEIFRGTNNRERYIGSWHVIAALLESGGFGIVTTHDLALTQLDKAPARAGRSIRNMHFRESVVDDALQFDYLLREGPCPTTNALRIMRAAGLPVPLEDTALEAGSPRLS